MTEFEKYWAKECKKHGAFPDRESAFKAFARHAWNAAIDEASSVCRDVAGWDDHCTSGAKECDMLIQELRSDK